MTTSVTTPNVPAREGAQPSVSISDYVVVTVLLALFGALLVFVTRAGGGALEPVRLLQPVFALVGLVAVVWLIMVVVRNASVLRGIASPAYYADYASKPPPDWVERPARTFDNLMQVPVLFYVVTLAMLATGRADAAQLTLGWIFVATRVVHAIVYIGWNYVPFRFAAWIAGCVTLIVLWTRFASLV